MSHDVTSIHNNQTIHAPFRVKSAGVSLVTIIVIGIYFFVNILSLLPSEENIPQGALNLTLTTIVLIILVEATLQVVLFIGAGQIENRTEQDDSIAAKASRNAYLILTAGVFATFGSLFVGLTPFEMGSILLLAFLLAEVVKFASQLLYYRRSTS